MGRLYENGTGVDRDNYRAVSMYERAIKINKVNDDDEDDEDGIQEALLALGYMYERGYGVVKDIGDAYKLYLRSYESGLVSYGAGFFLGSLYERGVGEFRKDIVKAVGYYSDHINLGNPEGHDDEMLWNKDSAFRLGLLYEHGVGVPKNTKTALRLFKVAASSSEFICHSGVRYGEHIYTNKSQFHLADIRALTSPFLEPISDSLPVPTPSTTDVSDMDLCVRNAEEQQDPRSLFTLGFFYQNGYRVEQEDHEKAMVYYRRAADKGHAPSMRELAMCYEDAAGDNQGYTEEAKQLYIEAIEADSDYLSLYRLGLIYESEDKIPEAFDIYKRAAEKGYDLAQQKLDSK
jgi:TPR repeat protein